MFSCYRAARLTIERLDRPLTMTERIRHFAHLFICSHCRLHDWQVRGLTRLFNMKRDRTDNSSGTNTDAGECFDVSLSQAARARIISVLSSRTRDNEKE
jgi:predicted protein tyrosine phosphatase